MCSVCVRRVQFLLAACGLALLLAACGGNGPTPEDRVRVTVDRIVEAIEAGEPRQVGGLLHRDYSDDQHPDRRSAVASLFWYTRQHRDIHLFTLIRDLRVDAEAGEAQGVVLVAMAGVPLKSIQSVVSVNADLYRFDVDWRLDDGEWRVISGRWQRADLSLL